MPEATPLGSIYSLHDTHRISLRINYPSGLEQMVLRTELDWDKNVLPIAIDAKGRFAEFSLETTRPFLYLKPCRRTSSGLRWATGANALVLATREEVRDLYPAFYSPDKGSISDLITLESKILGREHNLRVYLPAGYDENTCRPFPVMYMQDGRNLFFPQEAFMGQDWGVEDKLTLLDGMNAIEQMIIVGVYSDDRMKEYTSPGYESYGRSVVEEIKPYIDAHFRTYPGPRATGVMGSSLGGVVSFYMGWQWPTVFGNVGCLSSYVHPQRQPGGAGAKRGAPRYALLYRHRLAGGQLRSRAGHGGGAGRTRLSIRARLPVLRLPQCRTLGALLGAAAASAVSILCRASCPGFAAEGKSHVGKTTPGCATLSGGRTVMKSRWSLYIRLLCLLLVAVGLVQAQDPLPAWNDGAAKQAIVNFVKTTTDPSSPNFVPPEERIATFDQDGTTWVEHPIYTQFIFAFERVGELAPQHPEWKTTQPFQAVLTGDKAAMAKFTDKDLEAIMMATHTGMTVDQFHDIVKDWIAKAKDKRWNRPYTDLVYEPMLEAMQYLRANGYRTYIVTGGGQEFLRVYAQQVYGIPPEQIIGTAIAAKYTYNRQGEGILMRPPKVLLNDNFAGKAEDIYLFTGRHSKAAFGNSTGDQQMLEYTQAGGGAPLMMIVLHDDAQREYSYGPAQGLPNTNVGTFTQALYDEAQSKGWVVISMKHDWKRIFAFEK